MRFFGFLFGLAILGLAVGEAHAQVDVRFTEAPQYKSGACEGKSGRNLTYKKPSANADSGYKALFGVWCATTNNGQTQFLLAISEDDKPYEGKIAQVIKISTWTGNGMAESFGVAFFDTRQKRWVAQHGKGEAWFFWPEARGKLGQARGRTNGKTVRLFKGRKQTWVLLNKVK